MAGTTRLSVEGQYDDTSRLRARRSVWGPGPSGLDPAQVALDEIVSRTPSTVLEIGCGTGAFAEQVCRALPSADYLATDQSVAMVDATRARGIRAEVADATALPYPDGSFDVVVAAWMLYHVPDLDATLREVKRMLRPGGTLVAVTNGNAHLVTLVVEAGGRPLITQFSSENGEEILQRHFDETSRQDIETTATFADHAAATAYLETLAVTEPLSLRHFDGSRQDAGRVTVFTATR